MQIVVEKARKLVRDLVLFFFFLELRKSPDVSQFGQKDRHGVHFFNFYSTVWKFHDFSIAQILREINFGYSRSVKSATLTHLEALTFGFL